MGKIFKTFIFLAAAVVIIFSVYRLLFIRIVNYEVAGVKIPSEYNILTGKVKPIITNKSPTIHSTEKKLAAKDLGLSDEEAAIAQVRWAIFEQWAGSHPEFKGWDSDPQVFKKANDAFRSQMKKAGQIQIIK